MKNAFNFLFYLKCLNSTYIRIKDEMLSDQYVINEYT